MEHLLRDRRAGDAIAPFRSTRRRTAADDHVRRDFNPPAPAMVWCGDLTYLHTGEGWLYLATVIDLFRRLTRAT